MTGREEWIQKLLFPDGEDNGDYRVRLDENAKRSDVQVLSGIERLVNDKIEGGKRETPVKVVLSVDPLTISALLVAISVIFVVYIISQQQ